MLPVKASAAEAATRSAADVRSIFEYDGGLEVVVTSAAGCVLSFAESALGESAAARQTALGLEGFDWEQRRCDGAASGLRVVTVTSEAVNHRFFTMDQIEAHVANAHAA